MTDIVAFSQNWDRWRCWKCGVEQLVPSEWNERRRDDGAAMYCINGHLGVYKTSTVEKQRHEIERLKQQQARLEDERREAETRAAKAEAAQMRLKRRIGRGTCPCCKRTFTNVAAHMKTKHPELATMPLRSVS